ncbi:MAG: DUF4252 domain-containing protein [Chlorobi bacterium]|nr:DUF4252 domain-containing protein [Chlorobiota bacterium]
MKHLTIAFFMLISIWTTAQETQAVKFFNKYSGQKGYTSVYITKYMFDLFAKISNDTEDKEFHEITSKLNAIKILTLDSALNAKNSIKFNKELLQNLPKSIYKQLMIVKDGKQTVNFLINKKNDKISEFLMIVYGEGDPVLIMLEGDINLKNIAKLSKTMDVNDFKYLEKIDKK